MSTGVFKHRTSLNYKTVKIGFTLARQLLKERNVVTVFIIHQHYRT